MGSIWKVHEKPRVSITCLFPHCGLHDLMGTGMALGRDIRLQADSVSSFTTSHLVHVEVNAIKKTTVIIVLEFHARKSIKATIY